MKQIHNITGKFGLTEAEKAALDGLLYGIKEGRIATSKALIQLNKMLLMAMSIRGDGIHDVKVSTVRVRKAYREFMRDNRRLVNVNSNAGMGHRTKRKKPIHKAITSSVNAIHY